MTTPPKVMLVPTEATEQMTGAGNVCSGGVDAMYRFMLRAVPPGLTAAWERLMDALEEDVALCNCEVCHAKSALDAEIAKLGAEKETR